MDHMRGEKKERIVRATMFAKISESVDFTRFPAESTRKFPQTKYKPNWLD